MSGLTLQDTGTTRSHSRSHFLLRILDQDARLQAAIGCAPQPHRGYALLPTLLPSSHGQRGPPGSTPLPLQLNLYFRNLDRVINKQDKPLTQHSLLNIAREETKSRCGGRVSGDVIEKSTNARTPEVHPPKEATGAFIFIFHAVKLLSVVGVVKQAMAYRYE